MKTFVEGIFGKKEGEEEEGAAAFWHFGMNMSLT